MWMGKTASAASAHLAPCLPCACPPATPVPRSPAITASAMTRQEGEALSHLMTQPPPPPPCLSAHLLALTASPSRFRCVCDPGWSGPQCSQSLTRDACESQPCGAGGTCTSNGMDFHCTCPPGMQGVCPHVSRPGSPASLFLLPSLCSTLFLLYVCPSFFFFFPLAAWEVGIKVGTLGGDGNKKSLQTISLCLPTTGHQCELLSPCAPNPCEHGGHCEPGPGHLAVCSCPPGWQGT